MDIFGNAIYFLSSLLFSIAGVSRSAVGYTDGEPMPVVKQEYCFDDGRLLIGGLYGGRGLGQLAADAGLDFILSGYTTESEPDEYSRCGVGIIASYRNFPRYATYPRDAFYNADSTAYRDHPAIWGDYVIDEPATSTFDEIARAMKFYREQHPGKLMVVTQTGLFLKDAEPRLTRFADAVLHFFTDHHYETVDLFKSYLSEYIDKTDGDRLCFCEYPYGTDGHGGKRTEILYLTHLDLLSDVCKRTGRDLWMVTQACGNCRLEENRYNYRFCDRMPEISQQCYACLAFGARAIIHAQFGPSEWGAPESHMIAPGKKPTDTYRAVAAVNWHLKSFAEEYGRYRHVSTYLLNRRKVAGRSKGGLVMTVPGEKARLKSRNGLLVGTFDSDEGGKAYVVTNMEELGDEVTARATFRVPRGRTATVWQAGEASSYAAGVRIPLTLTPGEGVFITLAADNR